MKRYSLEQVSALLDQAVVNAEMSIYIDLKGADNETRLNSLDQLDMVDKVAKQLRILIDNEAESS